MMRQEETHEQTSPTYYSYEGNQAYAHSHNEASYEQMVGETPVAKVYSEPHNNQNMFRLIGLTITLVSLLAFAVICLILVGGVGGLISFCAACIATFIVASVAIDRIK
ncbi:hypothetical protein [Ktedonospora formicarum]|uniref:Uncharacterized protein n=1 Tax=Ktedonospora formicarum TaxID=2778364 RepID=A0A8J3MS88_9CHLR|nr:hypothetical protein [Ktedonospora formicarum]GHO45835.1 hypothetical protein KSX_39980 [Ktedonospora formicarum]